MYNNSEDKKYQVWRFIDREDWLRYRLTGIGGSDASCIIGANSYKNNQEFFREKVNREYQPIEDNDAMKYGREAEELIRELWRLDNIRKFDLYYEENIILTNKEYDYLMYSPDGLIEEIETGKSGIWECKTGEVKSSKSDDWKDKLPEQYYIQCLHGLLVTGLDFVILTADLKYYDRQGNPYFIRKSYRIDRIYVEKDLQYLLDKELEFWKCVLTNQEPNLILTL